MRDIIIGTAGHIDHGKTTVIKHLTGINTDTLPEESKRGMTINLGFAYYTLENGKKVGIIDVPGHEKFIKNMVAGASGIDFILLVIACDDGVMPQTIEHGNICSILGVNKGLIVLTKKDLVDSERVDRVKKQIKEEFKNSFISNLPTVLVSSKDETSFENMKRALEQEISKLELELESSDKFRMAIDRVFSVKGFGTVVTGTSISGEIKIGDIVTLYPNKTQHKVKGIQNHGESVEFLSAGNRCALNLSGVEVGDIKRGDIVSIEDKLVVSNRVDALFTLLNKDLNLKNNSRVRVHIGTTEVIGRVKLLKDDEIKDSTPSLIQIELEEDIVGVSGDIGIIRNYSPQNTIGGIKILNPKGEKVKKRDKDYIERLEVLLGGNIEDKIISIMKNSRKIIYSLEELQNELKEQEVRKKIEIKIENEIEKLVEKQKLETIINSEDKYILVSKKNEMKIELEKYLNDFHLKYPLKRGVLKAEIKSSLYSKMELKDLNTVLDKLKMEEFIHESEQLICLAGYKPKLDKYQKIIKDDILTIYKKYGFSPERYTEILASLSDKEKKYQEEFQKIHNYLVAEGLVTNLGEDIYAMRGFFIEGEKRLREYLEENKKITLSQYKDLLGVGRKTALLFLEKFDQIGITKRVEDYRCLK